ncbi:MAG: alpha-mannosidase, partial [Clostridia bacterium]|nr:alpha-mannosidase [Clostridia bacterium]
MPKVHLIGNAHIDPVWLWRWQDGFSETLATFRSAIDRLREFPDTFFTSACAVYYQWIEETDPAMFEEIRTLVKEGRWSIVGGWPLQPDCNIPDGESFMRHALFGGQYFKEKFGVTVKTGYNVDSFGHTAGLPKILRAAGMENYVFMRPSTAEQGNDTHLFWWESDDNSKVLAFRIPFAYGHDCTNIEDKVRAVKDMANAAGHPFMAFYGIGNHCGGPSIALIKKINALDIEDVGYSTPDTYFAAVDKTNLPTIKGELQHHARGCYAAESTIKAATRRCEQNLLAAEAFSVMAKHLVGLSYPAATL